MYELSHRIQFPAAHFLRAYEGVCRHTHGHNWEVWVTLEGRELSPNGTMVDFYEIERAVEPLRRELDHSNLNEIAPFTEISPTSENLARWICERLRPALEREGVRLKQVSVKEYENTLVVYRPE